MMFMGFPQTRLTALFGSFTGILLPAVLFAGRHHPSDSYFGIVNRVLPAGWFNHGIQLCLGAVIFRPGQTSRPLHLSVLADPHPGHPDCRRNSVIRGLHLTFPGPAHEGPSDRSDGVRAGQSRSSA
jgi:hypothetical protein